MPAPTHGRVWREIEVAANRPRTELGGVFLYLFDFGDEWHFGVKLVRTSETVASKAHFPRIVAAHGQAPPRYPDLDEEEWDEEDAG
ncbi:MAG: hypothetical protein ACRDJW_11560 [Thermomicrobiales bacterium]